MGSKGKMTEYFDGHLALSLSSSWISKDARLISNSKLIKSQLDRFSVTQPV